MTRTERLTESVRDSLLSDPDIVLEDKDIMQALIAANERAMGGNVVDLRGIAMERLEARLDRLEDTHRSVIAAAYDNLAGTNQIHRAILRMLDPVEFEPFVCNLGTEVAAILRVDAVRLVLESSQSPGDPMLDRLGAVLCVVEPGFTAGWLGEGSDAEPRPVRLRQRRGGDPRIYGAAAERIRSEACLRLDFGDGRLPGLLAIGSEDPHQFSPQQGTDLLTFFAGVFERAMRRWLA